MESTNSPRAPEPPLVASASPASPLPDDKKTTHIRFLVSNTEAGCIIGKGGSTITEFQSQSGARIQLSRNQEFFPGTSDRIILINGAFDEIIKAMELIIEKLLAEIDDTSDIVSRLKVRLVVPNSCCGGIIGKGGAIIKSLIEDSQAAIKISPLDPTYIGLNDRIVTLTGTSKEQIRAVVLILSKLAEDSHYSKSANMLYSYAGVNPYGFHGKPVTYVIPSIPYNTINYGPNGIARKHSDNKSMSMRSSTGTDADGGLESLITIGVADEHIGAVVGRGGRNIFEVTQVSGARIKISDRGDFMIGTSDRKITITGSSEAIRKAEAMIMDRISSHSEG